MKKKLTYKKVYALVMILIILIVAVGVFCSYLAVDSYRDTVVSSGGTDENADMTVIGFSQPGAESAWRVALTESIKDAFSEEKGFRLIYKDGQSKQDNQIRDIRTFIQQGVDYIILSPIVETGWDQVLEEAKVAGIPVIICDRNVTVSNESLYTAFVGSNFREEGMTAIECVEKILREREKAEEIETAALQQNHELNADEEDTVKAEETDETDTEDLQSDQDSESIEEDGALEADDDSDDGSDLSDPDAEDMAVDETKEDDERDYFNIVHIQGTLGSSAQVGRTRALEEAVTEHEDWRIVAQVCGDFTKGKAREEMTNILKEIDGNDIDMIYCENDEEAYGAMAALNEAGLTYGVNGKIMIVSFDGSKSALTMCLSGLINVEVECNPLQGDYICNIISHLEKGDKVPKIAYIDETYFTPDTLDPAFVESRTY